MTPRRPDALLDHLRNTMNRQWMDNATCKGRTALFTAPHDETNSARRRRETAAKTICKTCPVIDPCLWWARAHHEHGIWGGQTFPGRAACETRDTP